MKKPLVLFIAFVFLIIVAKFTYTKYCASKKERCNEETRDSSTGLPKKGIDW